MGFINMRFLKNALRTTFLALKEHKKLVVLCVTLPGQITIQMRLRLLGDGCVHRAGLIDGLRIHMAGCRGLPCQHPELR